MNAVTTILSPLGVQNADILRRAIDDPPRSLSAFARDLGRDKTSVRRTLGTLEEGGLIVRGEGSATLFDLTADGRSMLAAIDRANSASTVNGAGDVIPLLHAQILPDPLNPRHDFESDDAVADLSTLADDIHANGLLQNLVVRPHEGDLGGFQLTANGVRMPWFRLVAGERRWRAIDKLIRRGDLPEDTKILCKVTAADDLGHRLMALAENLQRRNLNPLEEAKAFQGLAFAGVSTSEIAARVNVTPRKVQLALQLLDLSLEDQERLTLSKDHPDYLSRPAALNILRGTTDSPKNSPSPAVDDKEGGATAGGVLTPEQLLILGELIDAGAMRGKDRPPYGREVEIRVFPDAANDETVGGLIGQGFIGFSSSYPARAYVTIAGREKWRAFVAGGDPGRQLERVRELAGVGPIETAALAEGDYVTTWLNLPKPPPPPGPLPIAQRVVLMEIMDRQMRFPAGGGRQGTEIAADRPASAFAGFSSLAYPTSPNIHSGGRAYVHLWGADRIAGVKVSQEDWDNRLREVQAEAGGKGTAKALKPGQYLTPWLNGPFEADPEVLGQIERNKLEQEAREAEDAEHERTVRALETSAAEGPLVNHQEELSRVLADSPLPWRVTEDALLDAKGDRVWISDFSFQRIVAIAVNSLAGLATPQPIQDDAGNDQAASSGEEVQP